jgi:RNA polymerase sigma-70 factor, ECF subfamily
MRQAGPWICNVPLATGQIIRRMSALGMAASVVYGSPDALRGLESVGEVTEETPVEARDSALRRLMARYQGGDLEAFEELYRRTLPTVRGYLAALTRDASRTADLAQETYLQIHRSRHTYDPRLPVKPWILAIARHVRLTDERSRWRRRAREVDGLEGVDMPVPPEVEGLADRDELARALAVLPGDRREALILHHVYGLSFREIGQVVGVSEGGARIRASRGMTELRLVLDRGRRRD